MKFFISLYCSIPFYFATYPRLELIYYKGLSSALNQGIFIIFNIIHTVKKWFIHAMYLELKCIIDEITHSLWGGVISLLYMENLFMLHLFSYI